MCKGEWKMKRGIFAFVTSLFLITSGVPGVIAAENKAASNPLQDDSIYYIMVDRFNNGETNNDKDVNVNNPNSYQGGDFQGIMEELDYIKEMGFTTILLTPIFDNAAGGYHGYWVNDFYQTEEHFGSIKTFKKLVEEAHKRDIKVMVDFVISHVGPNHPWLKDPEKENWFVTETKVSSNDNHVNYLNQDNPAVKEYLIDAAKWWINETDIDGYELLSYVPVSNQLLSEFTKEVKSTKENFYLLGDFAYNQDELLSFTEMGMDGMADYPYQQELQTVFPEPNHSFASLLDMQGKRSKDVPSALLMTNFMDNPNTIRLTHEIVKRNEHPGPRWKLALTYLFTTPGIPVMFYGSEIALDGGEAPDNHRMMNFRTDKELVDYITKISEIHSKFPSLSKGTMDVLYEKDGFAVYKRTYEEETTVIAINNTTETQTVPITAEQLKPNKELRGVLNGDLVKDKNNEYRLTIDRDESEIYVLSPKSDIQYSYIIAISAVLIAFFVYLYLVIKKSRAINNQKRS